jgi:hypothetical protein
VKALLERLLKCRIHWVNDGCFVLGIVHWEGSTDIRVWKLFLTWEKPYRVCTFLAIPLGHTLPATSKGEDL